MIDILMYIGIFLAYCVIGGMVGSNRYHKYKDTCSVMYCKDSCSHELEGFGVGAIWLISLPISLGVYLNNKLNPSLSQQEAKRLERIQIAELELKEAELLNRRAKALGLDWSSSEN